MCKYLVTAALPYANGPIHLGHLVEHIQVSIFVNALKMYKHDVLCVCGTDAHGTAIEIESNKNKITPEVFIDKYRQLHEKSLLAFNIKYDGGYGSTHTKKNKKNVINIFNLLRQKKHIIQKDIIQWFDPKVQRFLSDRLILGTCPKCYTNDQYGDNCEKCGSTYNSIELIHPKSLLSNIKPILKHSKHYFLKLNDNVDELKKWIFDMSNAGLLNKDIKKFLITWFKYDLKDWDISRDAPYFGFNIPDAINSYIYVWFDATIGYISLTELAAKNKNRDISHYWKGKDKNTQIIHFIGKDVIYFHMLFWPSILIACNYSLPTSVVVHGMLTINHKKMSKSRNTFILADDFLKHLPSEALRYYFGSKLNFNIEDIDLNFYDLQTKINKDLIDKIINIISRTINMLHLYNNAKYGDMENTSHDIIKYVIKITNKVKTYYMSYEYNKVIYYVLKIADITNGYLQKNEPWKNIKNNFDKTIKQITTALWCGKVAIALLKPIIPKLADKTKLLLNIHDIWDFDNILYKLPKNQTVQKYKILFNKIDTNDIEALLNLYKI